MLCVSAVRNVGSDHVIRKLSVVQCPSNRIDVRTSWNIE